MYENLNAEIGRKGLKRKDIAEKLNISTSALLLKIKGETKFTLDEAFKMVEMLGGNLSVEYLFKKEQA